MDRTVEELAEENRQMAMPLSAIRLIVTTVEPFCAKKLEELLNECNKCKE